MRILWVKADKLLPVHSGGNIRSYHIMRSLSAQHELTFFSYYGGHRDESYERELSDRLPGPLQFVQGSATFKVRSEVWTTYSVFRIAPHMP